MRLFTNGVPPRDRRLDRRPLAISAAAALLLFAALPAKAGIVGMNIDPTQSFVTVSEIIVLTEIGAGVHVTVPQFPGSNTTSLSGNLIVDLNPTTIGFPGGSTVNFDVNIAPGVGGVPGSYAPLDQFPLPVPGATPDANYGLKVGSPLDWDEVRHGLIADLIGPDRPLGTTFDLLPGSDLLVGTAGRIAYASALGGDTSSVVGDTLAELGTGGATLGTWMGGILTIPIESSFTVAIDTNDISPGTHVYITFISNSSIVAIIPEPASMVLWGFGVVGLLTFAGRFRRRRF